MATKTQEERLEKIEPKKLHPTKWNPRTIRTDTPDFRDLLESVKVSGVMIPVLTRPHPTKKGEYELLAGCRRHTAALLAERETIPAVVRDLSDEEAFKLTLLENFGREDLTPIEEGRAAEMLVQRFKGDKRAAAASIGKDERWIEQRMRLQRLTPKWQKACDNPDSVAFAWSLGHLMLIARLEPGIQDVLIGEDSRSLQDVKTWELGRGTKWSVSQLEGWIEKSLLRRLASAPWDLADATLYPKAGPCLACPKRSSRQGKLFVQTEDAKLRQKEDQCLDAVCWQRKKAAFVDIRAKEAKKVHGDKLLHLADGDLDYREQEELSRRFSNLNWASSFQRCKETDANAHPAVVVHGSDAGSVCWVKKKVEGQSTRGTSKKTPGKPTPLSERKKLLESKRWFEVLKALSDLVDKRPLKDVPLPKGETRPVQLVKLAAAFGTIDHEAYPGATGWSKMPKLKTPNDACEFLWDQVRAVLARRVDYNGPITQVGDYRIAEGKKIATLCGIDLNPLMAEAEKTYPVPKAWANLNADGTKKGEKQAKPKKAGKPKAPAGTSQGGAEEPDDEDDVEESGVEE